MDSAPFEGRSVAAAQQPLWEDPAGVDRVRRHLAGCPPLVRAEDVATLRELLARVAVGEALVLQCGDCAEDPAESDRASVLRKAALLDLLAGTLALTAGRPVLRVGRIGGQFCKPRSAEFERVGTEVLPVYRGHMVNRPGPTAADRRPDPQHILTGYAAASEVMRQLGWSGQTERSVFEAPVWTSHEALLLDYEQPMLRCQPDGSTLLTSTHWPWIGERTGQPDGRHVELLAGVTNPVACKVGPRARPDSLLALCQRLDPHRTPGRLTLIARMGAETVATLLPELVAAVRAAGHPAIWLCDPMHANTVTAPSGHKTRYLRAVVAEVHAFQRAVRRAGGQPGGLHLETSPDAVEECVPDETAVHRVGARYTSFCDPRLNPEQARLVTAAWASDAELAVEPQLDTGRPGGVKAGEPVGRRSMGQPSHRWRPDPRREPAAIGHDRTSRRTTN